MNGNIPLSDVVSLMGNLSLSTELMNSSAESLNSSASAQVPVMFSVWVTWLWTVIMAVLLALGTFGNCLVVAVVIRTRDLRSSTNLLLVNLAVADLMVLLVPLPTALIELHSTPEIWYLGGIMCKLVPFVEWAVSHASVLTITVIGTDRYYAICRPLWASYTITRVRAIRCICIIWMVASAVSLPTMLLSEFDYVSYSDRDQKVPTCFNSIQPSWAKNYYTVMIGALFFLPLGLLIVLYIFIYRKLIKDKHSSDLQRENDQDTVMRGRRQVVFMIGTVTIAFFVCLFPFRVFSMWLIWEPTNGKFIGPTKFYSTLYITRSLLYLNSSINPLLYSLTSSKFREAFVKLVHPGKNKFITRNSTLTRTGTSQSNGRSNSSRSAIAVETMASVTARRSLNGHHEWSRTIVCTKNSITNDTVGIRTNTSQYGRKCRLAGQHSVGLNVPSLPTARSDSVRSNDTGRRTKLECVKEQK